MIYLRAECAALSISLVHELSIWGNRPFPLVKPVILSIVAFKQCSSSKVSHSSKSLFSRCSKSSNNQQCERLSTPQGRSAEANRPPSRNHHHHGPTNGQNRDCPINQHHVTGGLTIQRFPIPLSTPPSQSNHVVTV